MLRVSLGGKDLPNVMAEGTMGEILGDLLTTIRAIREGFAAQEDQKAGEEFVEGIKKALNDPECPYFTRPLDGIRLYGSAARTFHRMTERNGGEARE